MVKIIHCVLLLGALFSISGCQNIFSDSAELDNKQQEFILSKVNNYRGLISLYRDKLNVKENAVDRYKLAKCYYLVEDYESSRLYLKPLLENQPDENVLLLEGQNLLALGHNSDALIVVARVLGMNTNNGEAWNIRGILLTQNGNFSEASQAFETARMRFVDEGIVINNLAMLAIVQEDYAKARDYLVPMYRRGQINKKILHNLVFALVKLKDFSGAENIIHEQNMSYNVDSLLTSLSKVKPRTSKELQQITSFDSIALLTQSLDKTRPESASSLFENVVKASESGMDLVNDTHQTSMEYTLSEISDVRAWQHPKYFRMTMESSLAIKFREVSSGGKNKSVFELLNVKLTKSLLKAGEKICRENHNVKSLKIYKKNSVTVGVELEFIGPVKRNNVFRLSANNPVKERLVFDIYL